MNRIDASSVARPIKVDRNSGGMNTLRFTFSANREKKDGNRQ